MLNKILNKILEFQRMIFLEEINLMSEIYSLLVERFECLLGRIRHLVIISLNYSFFIIYNTNFKKIQICQTNANFRNAT